MHLPAFPRAALRLALAALALALAAAPAAAAAVPLGGPAPDRLVVGPQGNFASLAEALAAAQPGDVIEVRGGTHPGPVVVGVPNVTLEGIGWPVIDGGGHGTVVTLAAAGAAVRGFEVRGSGAEPDQDHGGITLTAPGTMAENNRLVDVLFGVFVAEADGAVVRGNDITSKPEFELGGRGDGIRLWYSQDVLVEGNVIHGARDLVAWYSSGIVLRQNTVTHGRYGIHLMYCDEAVIEGNLFDANSVGIYTMYSEDVLLRQNVVRGQRGPSGYALGFKDADRITVTDNVLTDNRAGAYLDNTPFEPQGYARFERNLAAFNDVGVIMLPAVRGAEFRGNTFWENLEQVAVQGGGQLGENTWLGNYWSDAPGYDADGDGVSDLPYRSERLFEGLMDAEPALRALLFSPAVDALEMAAAAFPIVKPQPKFADAAPAAAPLPVPAWLPGHAPARGPLALAGAALVGLAVALGLVGVKKSALRSFPGVSDMSTEQAESASRISVAGVSKRYGKVLALSDVSFEAQPGEALALWGANGAGKTTLIKAILGLIEYQGQVQVAGHDARRAGKRARRAIGYVPQEVLFYEQSVTATLAFYARLKRVGPKRIGALLDRLGLAEHAAKPVSALSGGLRQRLALAVALLADPPVLLLDEPTANLDAQAQRDYLQLLKDLRQRDGKTILFASHRLEEVEALANRVLLLEHGQLVATLSPLDLLERLMPELELALWVPEAQRPEALAVLTGAGWHAHFNGRGTVVVRVRAEQKVRAIEALQARGIRVTDFDLLRGA